MSLKVIKTRGNIFDTKADIICNAVNCIGVMGAGVAKAFADKFPEMYWSYQNSCNSKMVNIGKGHYFICPMKIIGNDCQCSNHVLSWFNSKFGRYFFVSL